MTAVLSIDFEDERQRRHTAIVDSGLLTIERGVRSLVPAAAVAELRRAQRRLAAVEASMLADHLAHDGDVDELLDADRMSSATRRRQRLRAQVIDTNFELAEMLANDKISDEHLDLIAEAAAGSDGAAATDHELIDAITATDPDTGRVMVVSWLGEPITQQRRGRRPLGWLP